MYLGGGRQAPGKRGLQQRLGAKQYEDALSKRRMTTEVFSGDKATEQKLVETSRL